MRNANNNKEIVIPSGFDGNKNLYIANIVFCFILINNLYIKQKKKWKVHSILLNTPNESKTKYQIVNSPNPRKRCTIPTQYPL